MLFSWDWIRDHVDIPDISLKAASESLTDVGLTVESVEEADRDHVLDVEVTTNRPDAMNHRGLAREIGAAFSRDLRGHRWSLDDDGGGLPTDLVRIDAPDLCRRYSARLIEGIQVGPSPEWLCQRLTAIGLRPINNVVDATNYVLWDLGHPLHAFDRSLLEGGRIVVRRAREGETLLTLDGEERQLTPEMCVIADASRPVALAGVMGGAPTGVTEASTSVLLESAWFEPLSVRHAARAFAITTDSSHRFERGADVDGVLASLDAVTALILELAGGELVPGRADVQAPGLDLERPRIALRSSRVERLAGCPIPASVQEPVLTRLGFHLEPDGDGWKVAAPSFRVDIEIEDDLVEEVLRHHGYAKIPSILPGTNVPATAPTIARRRELAVRDALLDAGCNEIVCYSFYSAEDEARFRPEVAPAVVDNPLASTQSVMRSSVLASLLPAASHNVRHGRADVAIFEIGRAFPMVDGELIEERRAAFLIGGTWPAIWSSKRSVEFADGRGVIEQVLDRLGVPGVNWRAEDQTGFAAGRAAIGRLDDRDVCFLGELDPKIVLDLDLTGPWVGGELRLGRVHAGGPGTGLEESHYLPARNPEVRFQAFSTHPAIDLDVTVEHATTTTLKELVDAIWELSDGNLDNVALKDRWQGRGVPAGQVRTTLSFVYRHAERSLLGSEVGPPHEAMVEALLERFDARRG